MKYRKKLVTGLIGLAMLAAPITAAAKDNDSGSNNSHQAARSEVPRNDARHEVREQRAVRAETHTFAPRVTMNQPRHDARQFNRAPIVVNRPPVVVNRPVVVARPVVRDRDYDWAHDRLNHSYRSYGYVNREYLAPFGGNYVMPRGYAGGSCAWAQRLRRVYQQDRATGHPAAANDLLVQMHRAERNCGTPYGYNGKHYRSKYYRY